jgi:hypothetical protein
LRFVRNLVVAWLVLGLQLASSPAFADPPTFALHSRFFPVTFEPSETAAQVEVERIGEKGILAEKGILGTCMGACNLLLAPGRYMIKVTEQSGKSSKEAVTITEPQRLALVSPDREAKYGGLALGIAGTTLVGVSLLLALFSADPQRSRDRDGSAYVVSAMATGVLGAVAAPIGWVMFAENRKLRIDRVPFVRSPNDAPASGPTISLGLIHTAGGAIAAGGIAF